MKNQKGFLSDISEILETEINNVGMKMDFRNDVKLWDSLKGLV